MRQGRALAFQRARVGGMEWGVRVCGGVATWAGSMQYQSSTPHVAVALPSGYAALGGGATPSPAIIARHVWHRGPKKPAAHVKLQLKPHTARAGSRAGSQGEQLAADMFQAYPAAHAIPHGAAPADHEPCATSCPPPAPPAGPPPRPCASGGPCDRRRRQSAGQATKARDPAGT